MKRKTIIMMTAMIICSLLSFGCSKKANITVVGGTISEKSIKVGDYISLKCDSPESFAYWTDKSDSPISYLCNDLIKVKESEMTYTAVENEFLIIASFNNTPYNRILEDGNFIDIYFDESDIVEDFAAKSFGGPSSFSIGNVSCPSKMQSADGHTTYTCNTTIYSESLSDTIAVYTGAFTNNGWTVMLHSKNVSSNFSIQLNDNTTIYLNISRTTDSTQSFK